MNTRSNGEGMQPEGSRLSRKRLKQLHGLLAATLVCGAVIATPQLAKAGTTTLSGAQNTPQVVVADPDPVVIVDTTDDFSVNTATDNALLIQGSGSISYDDGTNNSSLVTTDGSGLVINSTGNNGGTPGSVTVVTGGNITGSANGVLSSNSGTGGISITTTGTVTGQANDGINVNNSNAASTGTVSVFAGTVDGNTSGMSVLNFGTGSTNITATGEVTATNGSGIGVYHAGNNLVINTTAVTGNTGILVYNVGTGLTSITATDTITGQSGSGIVIAIDNVANTGGLTINVEDVTGTADGINITNAGTGAISVTATDTVEGGGGDGIFVNNTNAANTGGVTINVEDVTGSADGIDITNAGIGATSVTATDTVEGTTGQGVVVNNSNALNTGGVTVSVAGVNAGTNGINVTNAGTGATSVTATGTVAGTTGTGITATNSNALNTGALTVSAAAVNGGAAGITAVNAGTGATSVTATGTVTGTSSNGIGVINSNILSTGAVTISAAGVSGGTNGIGASTVGTGAISITATGNVTGTASNGIVAGISNVLNTGGVTVSAVGVSGGTTGIGVQNNGLGATSVTATGAVVGANGVGINVIHNGAALTVNAAAVTGSTAGIAAVNTGTGATNITASGTVTGSTESGISVAASGAANNVTVTAQAVSGQENGMYIINTGIGTTTINANGTTTGTNATGITAGAGIAAGNIEVNVASNVGVTGGTYGVFTSNLGTGTTTIDVNGVAQGGIAGILANSSGSQAIEINIDGEVRNSSLATNALAISSNSGAVTINNNYLITGTVSLGDQGNTFNNINGWNTAGGTSTLGTGVNTLDNRLNANIVAATISGGPVNTTVNGVDTFIHSGNLVLQNEMLLGNTGSVVGDVATFTDGGSGEFRSNNGALYLDTDVENGTSDRLAVDNVVVTGGATTIFVNHIGPGRATSGDGIQVVDVDGSSDNDAFVLAGPVQAGLFNYNLGQGDVDTQSWFLQSNYRDEVIAAGALSVLGSRTALATLSNLNERQRGGETFSDDQDGRKGIWARAYGQDTKFRSDGGTNAGFNANTWGAQAGMDLLATDSGDGDRKYAGLYIGYATSNGDALNGSSRVGSLDVDATSLGAYFTKYDASGWYVDAAAQYSKLGGIRLRTADNTERPDGKSYALSLEGGQRFNRESRINTEVQAQLIYQKTDIDDVTLSDSTRLAIGSTNTLTGRLGVRLAKNPEYAGRFQPWVRANLWHTFNKDANVSSQGATASTPVGGTSGEVQVGFALTPSQSSGWSAYVSGGYLFDLSGSEYSGWKGTLGVRKGW